MNRLTSKIVRYILLFLLMYAGYLTFNNFITTSQKPIDRDESLSIFHFFEKKYDDSISKLSIIKDSIKLKAAFSKINPTTTEANARIQYQEYTRMYMALQLKRIHFIERIGKNKNLTKQDSIAELTIFNNGKD